MKIKIDKTLYAISKLVKCDKFPAWINFDSFFSITNTDEEFSIVCEEKFVPKNIISDFGWNVLKIVGPLDFSLVGILSNISSILAKEGISIFAISTYDTDYILVKSDKIEQTIEVLKRSNYEIVE